MFVHRFRDAYQVASQLPTYEMFGASIPTEFSHFEFPWIMTVFLESPPVSLYNPSSVPAKCLHLYYLNFKTT